MAVNLDQEIRVTRRLEGQPFYNTNLPTALQEAQSYAGDRGFVASMPALLHGRVTASADNEIWSNWYTALSEEDVGIDTKGKFVKKGKPVVIAVHGGGVLSTPERIQAAYDQGLTNTRAAKFTEAEVDDLLAGKLPDGTDIPVVAFDDFKKGVSDLPQQYGVVIDFDAAKRTKSDYQKINDLRDNPLVIVRAGGVAQANAFLDKAAEVYDTKKLGNWHPFNNVDPQERQGRLLFLGSSDYYSLDGYLDDVGRFVGVAPEALDAREKSEPVTTPLVSKVETALRKQEAFEHNGTLYVPVADKRVRVE